MSIYALAHIIHVYCAIAFVGGVIFRNAGSLRFAHRPRFARIAPRSRTCHVLSCRPRNAACRHYLVHQRHRDGVQPLPADTSPPIRQLFRHHAEHQNPVGNKRFGTFCHRRRQNGTAHPHRRLVEIHTRRRIQPYAVYRLFCQSNVLPVLVNLTHTPHTRIVYDPIPVRRSPMFYGIFFIAVLIMIAIDMVSLKKNGAHKVSIKRSPHLEQHLGGSILRICRLALF